MTSHQPLDILMISDVYAPRVNGVSTSIATFRREFEALGHSVRLVAPEYPGHHDGGEAVLRIPAFTLPLDPEDRLMRSQPLNALEDYLRRKRPDLIHIHTPFAAHHAGVRLARRLGVPVVESYHTYFEEYFYHYIPFLPRGLLRWAARRLSRAQCNRLNAMVVPGHSMLDVLRGYGIDVPAAVIPTGIDLARFDYGDGAAFRARHGIAAQCPLLLFVGRVAFEKNIAFLFEALGEVRKTYPDALLLVCGEGPALPALRRRAKEMNLADNVLFLGYLRDPQALCDCYAAADLFVFASRTETQGLVLLEAMALGTPVVAVAEMGVADILAGGRGALVAPLQPVGFAAQILRLLADPQMRQALGDEARRYAATWSARAMAEKMLDFYREVLEKHASGAASAFPPSKQ